MSSTKKKERLMGGTYSTHVKKGQAHKVTVVMSEKNRQLYRDINVVEDSVYGRPVIEEAKCNDSAGLQWGSLRCTVSTALYTG